MKRLMLIVVCVLITNKVHSEEGMWLPMLLKGWHEGNMQQMGCKFTADSIYSVNHTSMKDAVVLFNGGCTAEVISDKGLLLTNHHCGFGNIQALSTVANNLLDNGYWAYSMDKELPCAGLSVMFIVRIEDVTQKIIGQLHDSMSEDVRAKRVKEISDVLKQEAIAGTHYGADVRAMYYGNEYYMFVTETFDDVRLVGTPPASIGNFGGEADNWMWPRHTGDFSIFRIYANSENKPAKYSASNVPFKPRHFFPISLRGVQEGDFTMVYGFPGRTQEYLPSVAVDFIVNQVDPTRVSIRDKRLEQMYAGMRSNDTTRLQYASKAKSLANAYKKWKGEMIGIQQTNAVEAKRTAEKKMMVWINNDEGRKKKYGGLLREFDKVYADYRPLAKVQDYTNEAANGVELLQLAASFTDIVTMAAIDTISDSVWTAACTKKLEGAIGFYKNYDVHVDKNVCVEMLCLYRDSISADKLPEMVSQWLQRGDVVAYCNSLYVKSVFANREKLVAMLQKGSRKKIGALSNDMAYALSMSINSNYQKYNKEAATLQVRIAKLMRTYMQALREYNTEKKFYPDANSTLRVAYGNVRSYYPRNGVLYTTATTAAGIREKYNAQDEDFVAPAKLIALIDSKDYGVYGVNGDLPVAFIATNHTTGGNSGSPVLNANGELIGTNYDRVWEGTMSDLNYDISRCRNITLDVRYTLFIIDKYAGAKNLIDELTIVR